MIYLLAMILKFISVSGVFFKFEKKVVIWQPWYYKVFYLNKKFCHIFIIVEIH